MTGDEFRSRFRLLKRLTKRGVITFHALDAGGQFRMVHFVRGAPALKAKLRSVIEQLSPPDRRRILEIVDVEDTTAVVTELLQDFTDFAAWLKARVNGPGSSGDSAVRRPAPPTPETAPAPSTTPTAGTPPPAQRAPARGSIPPAEVDRPPRRPAPPAPVQAGDDDPSDEFAQLFGPALQGSGPEPPADPIPETPDRPARPRTPPAAQPSSKEPGEFTGLFGQVLPAEKEQAPAASGDDEPRAAQTPPPPEQAPPPPRPKRAKPGEFTRLFGPSGEGASDPPVDAPSPPPPPPPQAAPRAPEPPLPRRDSGAAANVYPVLPPQADAPQRQQRKPRVRWRGERPAEPPPPPPSPPQQPSGPGEFSQLFGTSGHPKPPGVQPPAPARRPRPLEPGTQDYLKALRSEAPQPPAAAPSHPEAPAPAPPPPEQPEKMPPLSAPPPPLAPGGGAGMSEFSQVVAGVPEGSAPSDLGPPHYTSGESEPAEPPPGRAGPSPRTVLVWGLAALGVIAVIAIIIFIIVT